MGSTIELEKTSTEQPAGAIDMRMERIIQQDLRGERVQQYLAEKQQHILIPEEGVSMEDMPIPFSFEELMYYYRYAEIPQLGHHIYGELDIDALKASFRAIIERQESLRTVYTEVDQKKLTKKIIDADWFELNVVDLTTTDSALHQSSIHKQAQADFDQVLSYQTPLFTASLFVIDSGHAVMLVTGNHLILDIWGIGVLFNELSELYRAFKLGKPSPLEPLPMQYQEFVAWQQEWYQSPKFERMEKYWGKRLADLPLAMNIPQDRPRLEETGCMFVTVPVNLSAERLDELEAFAAESKTTLFNMMLAVVSVLLVKHSQQTDVVIGYPKAGRIRADYANMIGNLTDLMVFRNQVDLHLSFKEMLLNVTKTAFRDYANVQMPFLMMKKLLKQQTGKDYQQLLRFCVNILPENGDLELEGAETKRLEMAEIKENLVSWMPRIPDNIDFRFFINRGVATLTYNSELYDASTIEAMLQYFDELVEAILQQPDIPLAELALGLAELAPPVEVES